MSVDMAGVLINETLSKTSVSNSIFDFCCSALMLAGLLMKEARHEEVDI